MNFKHCRQVYRCVREERIIIHCDLDAFFASVEILHHGFPEDEPLIIGSDPMQGRGRGIVSTCNYAAREYGVRSAMPISEAWRRCPGHPFGPARYHSWHSIVVFDGFTTRHEDFEARFRQI